MWGQRPARRASRRYRMPGRQRIRVAMRTRWDLGARRVLHVQAPSLPALSPKLVEGIHRRLFETLKEKFATLPALGSCWIDEELKKIPLPTDMRSMNFSTKPSVRGQRIPFDNKDTKTIKLLYTDNKEKVLEKYEASLNCIELINFTD